MDNYEALKLANRTWVLGEDGGPEAIKLLAHTGLFTHREIAKIADTTTAKVLKHVNRADLPKYSVFDNFDPRVLDVLMILSWNYKSRGIVPLGMLKLAQKGASNNVIARLTGVPIEHINAGVL